MASNANNTASHPEGESGHSDGEVRGDGLSAHRERQIDLVFDWLEENYSHYFPSHQESFYREGYRTRYYPSNDGYLFVKDDDVHFSNYYEELEPFSLEFWLELSGITAEEEEARKEELRQEEERKEAARQEEARQEAERKYNRDFRSGVMGW